MLSSRLNYAASATFDELTKYTVSRRGDTLGIVLSAEAPNAFGVKDDVMLIGDFICRDGALYWDRASVGGDRLFVRGRPVDPLQSIDWVMGEKWKEEEAAYDAYFDSLARDLNPKIKPL